MSCAELGNDENIRVACATAAAVHGAIAEGKFMDYSQRYC